MDVLHIGRDLGEEYRMVVDILQQGDRGERIGETSIDNRASGVW